ncbi:putative oligopeptide transporter [Melampsora larici-populina 98AG31]|uniref:Putative oligopeptide transporter n=1 Tax=Melampsora larici-populina (strain 98AG31 / pathotype 3-4-7) TaxID=747676 RepID=F4S7L9_MELLP|nr:putative oligopeptide transporter [Melampsora larici-populina 98AG31]EGF99343.1 putative oligopeptide transporter [Melampsora larici-populina 98AG31]
MDNAHVPTQEQINNPEGLQTGPKSPSADGNEPEHTNPNSSEVQLPDLLHSDLSSNRGEKEIYKDGSVDVEQADIIRYLRLVIEENQLLHQAAQAIEPGVPAHEVNEIAMKIRAELQLGQDNSPYAEVKIHWPTNKFQIFRKTFSKVLISVDRSALALTPAMTPQHPMWTLGLILVILGTGLNQFFAPRLPGIYLSVTFAQMVAFPLGCLMARILPTRVFGFGKYSFTLNPGPFNKNRVFYFQMANASWGGAYASDMIAVLRVKEFYNNDALAGTFGFQLTLILSTQLMGYSIAGLTRSVPARDGELPIVYHGVLEDLFLNPFFVIKVWWDMLLEITVLRALHAKDDNLPVHGWKISRMNFFFAYHIWDFLSYFNWTTWIAPNNVKLAIITGTVSGLGLNPFPTLDWNFMYTDPIVTPLWSILNSYGGMLIGFVIICVIYFKNMMFTAYLPVNSNAAEITFISIFTTPSGVFDRMGKRYNASRVLNEHGVLDEAQYQAYSPPFMSASHSVLYFGFMALYSSTLVHAALHYRKYFMRGYYYFVSSWKASRLFKKFRPTESPTQKSEKERLMENTQDDIHYRLMKAYPEVPEWWFMLIGVIAVTLAVLMIEYYKTDMPIWGIVFAYAIALLLIIPSGIMEAVASTSAPLNVRIPVLSELIGGYALAGRPIANMLFKSYGFVTMSQALSYASDMKLAHYVKIPPKALFAGQTAATVLSAFVSMAVLDWQIAQFPDLCSPTQRLHFTCPTYGSYFTASVLWGLVAPARMFSNSGALYKFCMYGFLIGAIAPFIPWALSKKYPRAGWKFVHTPVIISGLLAYAPLSIAYYTPAIPLAIFFQHFVKRRYTAWYEKYALTLTAGIGGGIAIFGLIYFFAFQMNGKDYDWPKYLLIRFLNPQVGNTIYSAGCDGQECTLKEVPQDGFGPTTWS